MTEWLPRLLEELLPSTIRAVRELVADHRAGALDDKRLGMFVNDVLHEDVFDLGYEDDWTDADAEVAQYALDIAELALLGDRVVGTDSYAQQLRAAQAAEKLPSKVLDRHLSEDEQARLDDGDRLYDVADDDVLDELVNHLGRDLVTAVTKIGTGRGPVNAGLKALVDGPVRLHEHVEERPRTLVLFFDGPAWESVQERETAARSLAAIAALGTGFDVRVAPSPSLNSHLERRFSDWYDAHLRLTEGRKRCTEPAPSGDDEEQQLLLEAWEAIEDLPPKKGKVRLLANLTQGEAREYRDLRRDDEIGLAPDSIEPYVQDLSERGLVAVTKAKYNKVELTETGEVALDRLITPDYGFRHPLQSELRTGLTPTPQRNTSTVYRAKRHTRDPPGRAAAEDHLAETGTPGEDAQYVQWLDGPSDRLDAWAMHHRLMAGQRVEGVTCVDHDVEAFEDGRVAYISCFDDTMLVATQWGKSLPTLARVTAALLSDRAMSKILTESAVGKRFRDVYDGSFEEAVDSVLQRGAQIGWFSEDELDFDSFRDRYGMVRSMCLKRLGEVAGTTDYEQRQALYRDLHGLLASATHLYNAAGIDITVNIRVPDTTQLLADEQRHADFLDFFQYTVPKNAVYGCHSVYRLLLEKDEQKLRSRLPYDVSADDPMADLTANWVVSGPNASFLTDDIRRAIEREAENVREQILDGHEEAPVLEVPVVEGNSYGAIKQVIEQYAQRKGFSSRSISDVRRLVRVCMAFLGTRDRGASPYDVAELMLSIGRQRGGDLLTVGDIAFGLSQLPADRLLPELPRTAQKMVSVLLSADEPLGRSEIIDRAGISGSSYDRHIGKLAAYAVFEPTSDQKWEAWIEPWWAAGNDLDEPRTDQDTYVNGDAPPATPARAMSIFFWVAIQEDPDLLNQDTYDLYSWPPDYEKLLRESELYSRWCTFVMAHQAPVDRPAAAVLDDTPGSEWLADAPLEDERASREREPARIGRLPAAAEPDQTTLSVA